MGLFAWISLTALSRTYFIDIYDDSKERYSSSWARYFFGQFMD